MSFWVIPTPRYWGTVRIFSWSPRYSHSWANKYWLAISEQNQYLENTWPHTFNWAPYLLYLYLQWSCSQRVFTQFNTIDVGTVWGTFRPWHWCILIPWSARTHTKSTRYPLLIRWFRAWWKYCVRWVFLTVLRDALIM